MGIEIERKFLLANDEWRAIVVRSERIAQGYLSGSAAIQAGVVKCTVRVRISGELAWLNIKSATLGISRQEFEYPIPVTDAERLLSDLSDGALEKSFGRRPIVWQTPFTTSDNRRPRLKGCWGR